MANLPATLSEILHTAQFHAWLEDPLLQVDEYGLRLRDDVTRDEALSLPAIWPEGRLFNAAVDLRWERRPDGHVHLVAIADSLPATFREPTPLPLTRVRQPYGGADTEHVLLWGQRPSNAGDEWSEGRIPDPERFYPDWKGPRAAIESRTYESEWRYDNEMPPAVRIVTRYLGFIGAYKAPFDKRFANNQEPA